MDAAPNDPNQWQAARYRAELILESIFFLLVVCAIVAGGFDGAHRLLVAAHWSTSWWTCAESWLAVGLACSLVWPLRYRRGMQGHWLKSIFGIIVLSLTGPFALLFGFPV